MKTCSNFLLLAFSSILLLHCQPKAAAPEPETTEAAEPKMSHEEHVARGKYLVEIMGCHDCHSPKIMTDQGPVPDPNRLLSGYPAESPLPPVKNPKDVAGYALMTMDLTAAIGPWGTTFAANLTPDETGLGSWTLEQFDLALRKGKSKGMEGNRSLLPPMPWANYRDLKNEDLAAIWAYLQSIPPVKNVPPPPVPPMGM